MQITTHRTTTAFGIGVALSLIALTAAHAEHRQLGPHVHGHGTLNIAVEANTVSMELDAPGMDINGFEHEATTTADKATQKKSEAALKDATALFAFPAAAGCKLKDAKVAVEGDSDHDHDHDHGDHDHDAHHHNDYNVAYTLDCAKPDEIHAIQFGYFNTFPRAQSLTVNIVSSARQASFEVTRERPMLEISGGL